MNIKRNTELEKTKQANKQKNKWKKNVPLGLKQMTPKTWGFCDAPHLQACEAWLIFSYINPFSPRSDQHLNSPYNFHALLKRQVMRIKMYNTKLSGIVNIEIYGNRLGVLAFRSREWKGWHVHLKSRNEENSFSAANNNSFQIHLSF